MQVLTSIQRDKATEWADVNPVRALRVRCLSLSDRSRTDREMWLSLVFTEVETFSYCESGYTFLSTAVSDFDVLIVSGTDVRRMASIIRFAKPLLRNRICIGLIGDANARARAKLLAAGVDDVFLSKKMHPIEAVARMGALLRRYALSNEITQKVREEEKQLSKLCAPSALTEREKRLLGILLTSRENFARYESILSRLSDYHEQISLDSLKLIVCRLRSKLRPGVGIIARRGEGYQLTYP